jgi:hypothetical protein
LLHTVPVQHRAAFGSHASPALAHAGPIVDEASGGKQMGRSTGPPHARSQQSDAAEQVEPAGAQAARQVSVPLASGMHKAEQHWPGTAHGEPVPRQAPAATAAPRQ